MAKGDVSAIKELGRNLDLYLPKVTCKKIMEGSERIAAVSSKKKLAKWIKGAMERMDALVDEKTRIEVMESCGHNCALVHKNIITKAKGRRKKYKGIDEFLKAEQRTKIPGSRLVRRGNVLYQFYTPSSFARPVRCYCGLLRGLPADEMISPTYCHCAKGFVKSYWEGVLERPLKVDLIQSVVTGAKECKFAIYI